jgi:mannose-6-phosphate isomerase-like protein (cupin superfamily)
MNPNLNKQPIHLGRGATAITQPEFTGVEWYGGYMQRHASDGTEGRLVAMHTFETPWEGWEVHPNGHEVVICTAGEITLIQEINGKEVRTTLKPGEYAINPPGVWHTADVTKSATCLFITAGAGTQGRPRATKK